MVKHMVEPVRKKGPLAPKPIHMEENRPAAGLLLGS